MIEIGKADSRKSIKERIKSLKSKKGESVNVKQSQFLDNILEIQRVEEVKLELDELIGEIDIAGKEFENKQTMETLNRYKSLIKSFLDKVVKDIYRIKEKYGKKHWMKQKVYVVIEKINDKLEKLTNTILNKESEHINLLATLDDIRGMLVDLYK